MMNQQRNPLKEIASISLQNWLKYRPWTSYTERREGHVSVAIRQLCYNSSPPETNQQDKDHWVMDPRLVVSNCCG